MKVTLRIFSGRPNPSWIPKEAERRELLNRLLKNADPTRLQDFETHLGFGGLEVTCGPQDLLEAPRLPQHFLLPSGPNAAAKRAAALPTFTAPPATDDDTIEWLLATAPPGQHEDAIAAA